MKNILYLSLISLPLFSMEPDKVKPNLTKQQQNTDRAVSAAFISTVWAYDVYRIMTVPTVLTTTVPSVVPFAMTLVTAATPIALPIAVVAGVGLGVRMAMSEQQNKKK